ncbi:hypothetical protein JCM18694_35390 [Prolixibacter denitrificans]|nr:hypothetical protein JCM18694_35390 [Prolixibacter denitrificans]
MLAAIYLYDSHKLHSVKRNSLYSIGIVTGVHGLARGGKAIEYGFSYQKRNYKGDFPTNLPDEQTSRLIDKRFLVVFDSIRPSWNRIILKYEINDSSKNPTNGWKKIPSQVIKTTHNN